MKVIDAHAHIYERLTGFGPRGEARAIGGGKVEWATGQVEQFLNPDHGDTGFSAETLIGLMDAANVEKAVLLQGSNYGFQNSYIAESVAKFPDRLIGSGSFDPYCLWADDIYKNLTENFGFRILKFEISQHYGLAGYHPDLAIDGKLFDRYFSMAEEQGITVTIDTGIMGTSGFQPEGLKRVMENHKDLRLVIAHSLFPMKDENNPTRLGFIKQLAGENTYFDIANLHAFVDRYKIDYIRSVMDIVGSDHMLWGTDCPGAFMSYSYQDLISCPGYSGLFTDAELQNLMHDTAENVYQ